MIDTAQAIALGVIQGLTEYLPVSSSGHLVVAHHLFGLTEPAVFFDVVLHIGTLLAVIWFYR
ncbi:MAG: undecaprenyl-diphosphate phosphatase, partial [Rectinemataceae bacterium]|nr:undecaprenyl-diphosphate phosphatase [Rectinemataceae bacterium]